MDGDSLEISKNILFIIGHLTRSVLILYRDANNNKNIFGDFQTDIYIYNI
jgi:hypothetical protein